MAELSRPARAGDVVHATVIVTRTYDVYLTIENDGDEPLAQARQAGLVADELGDCVGLDIAIVDAELTKGVADA